MKGNELVATICSREGCNFTYLKGYKGAVTCNCGRSWCCLLHAQNDRFDIDPFDIKRNTTCRYCRHEKVSVDSSSHNNIDCVSEIQPSDGYYVILGALIAIIKYSDKFVFLSEERKHELIKKLVNKEKISIDTVAGDTFASILKSREFGKYINVDYFDQYRSMFFYD